MQERLDSLHPDERGQQAQALVLREWLAMLSRLDDPAKPQALFVLRDVLDLVGDRAAVRLAKLG